MKHYLNIIQYNYQYGTTNTGIRIAYETYFYASKFMWISMENILAKPTLHSTTLILYSIIKTSNFFSVQLILPTSFIHQLPSLFLWNAFINMVWIENVLYIISASIYVWHYVCVPILAFYLKRKKEEEKKTICELYNARCLMFNNNYLYKSFLIFPFVRSDWLVRISL